MRPGTNLRCCDSCRTHEQPHPRRGRGNTSRQADARVSSRKTGTQRLRSGRKRPREKLGGVLCSRAPNWGCCVSCQTQSWTPAFTAASSCGNRGLGILHSAVFTSTAAGTGGAGTAVRDQDQTWRDSPLKAAEGVGNGVGWASPLAMGALQSLLT